MADSDARLSIDYWHTNVSAALRTTSGGIVAVAVDGDTVLPAGVAVEETGDLAAGRRGVAVAARDPQRYVRTPSTRLFEDRVEVGSSRVDPVDLVGATLTLIARDAQTVAGELPPDVVISVPAVWVHRQRAAILEAARRANLGRVELATFAESVLHEQEAHGSVVPVGTVAAVCRLDATVGELVVLRREVSGFKLEASIPLGELGETPGSTLVDQAVTALAAVMDPAWTINAVCYQAPATMAPELSSALSHVVGPTVTPVQVADVAAAFGGARRTRLVAGSLHGNSLHGKRWAWGRITGNALAAVFALSAAIMLVYQVLSSGVAYEATSTSAETLATATYALGMAPVLATLGMIAAALLVVDLSRRRRHGRDPALGSALAFAAILGTASAGILALSVATNFAVDPRPLLRWTLGSTVPLSVLVGALGVVTARADDTVVRQRGATARTWRDHVRFPLVAVILVAVSTVTLVASEVGVPTLNPNWWWPMEHIGAFGLAWAIACMVTTDPWRRITLGSLLSVASAYAISIDTADAIAVCVILAVTLWWLLRLGRILLAVLTNTAAGERQDRQGIHS